MHQTRTRSDSLPRSGPASATRGMPPRSVVCAAGWPLERVLFALAGTVAAASAALTAAISPWFLLLTAFVAANQLAYAAFGVCGASFVLRRFAGLTSALFPDRKGM